MNPEYEGKTHAVALKRMPRSATLEILRTLPSMHPFQFYHTYYATKNSLVRADAYRTYISNDMDALNYISYDVWGASDLKQDHFRWTRPNTYTHRRAIRQAETRWNLVDLTGQVQTSEMIPLTDALWKNLEGTVSRKVRNGDVGGALRMAVTKGLSFRSSKQRLEKFKKGGAIEAAIVLDINNEYHLLTGELTLLLCKATKIMPTVVMVRAQQAKEIDTDE